MATGLPHGRELLPCAAAVWEAQAPAGPRRPAAAMPPAAAQFAEGNPAEGLRGRPWQWRAGWVIPDGAEPPAHVLPGLLLHWRCPRPLLAPPARYGAAGAYSRAGLYERRVAAKAGAGAVLPDTGTSLSLHSQTRTCVGT